VCVCVCVCVCVLIVVLQITPPSIGIREREFNFKGVR
jgi:hypothetical protein